MTARDWLWFGVALTLCLSPAMLAGGAIWIFGGWW